MELPLVSNKFETHKELYRIVFLSLAVMEWNCSNPFSQLPHRKACLTTKVILF
jgi:hypothetical protein